MVTKILRLVFSCFCLSALGACQRENSAPENNLPIFDSIPSRVELHPMIAEASGIAASKKNANCLWVHEDSNTPPQIYLLNQTGEVVKKMFIRGATNRDWEDMTLADDKIYLGDIGDNNDAYPEYYFYIFEEPDKSVDTVEQFQKLRFKYPDGARDAEAFLVEPASGTIYIISKWDNPSRIYKLTITTNATSIQTAEYLGQINATGITSAAMSADGTAVILKTYTSVLYFHKDKGESMEKALQRSPVLLPYSLEPQGEAICFAADDSGYFTLSELGFSSSQFLYFFRRK